MMSLDARMPKLMRNFSLTLRKVMDSPVKYSQSKEVSHKRTGSSREQVWQQIHESACLNPWSRRSTHRQRRSRIKPGRLEAGYEVAEGNDDAGHVVHARQGVKEHRDGECVIFSGTMATSDD